MRTRSGSLSFIAITRDGGNLNVNSAYGGPCDGQKVRPIVSDDGETIVPNVVWLTKHCVDATPKTTYYRYTLRDDIYVWNGDQ